MQKLLEENSSTRPSANLRFQSAKTEFVSTPTDSKAVVRVASFNANDTYTFEVICNGAMRRMLQKDVLKMAAMNKSYCNVLQTMMW